MHNALYTDITLVAIFHPMILKVPESILTA